MAAMMGDAAARHLLGLGWREIEGAASELIDQGRAAVARWEWVRSDETLWEMPLPMAGDEAPMRALRAEPTPRDRAQATSLGFDDEDRVVAARYFHDHWEGREGGYQLGVPHVDAVTVNGVLVRFVHERHGGEHHRIRLRQLVDADRAADGRLLETRWWSRQDGREESTRTTYHWDGPRLVHAISTRYEGGLDDEPLRRVRQDYVYDADGLLRVSYRYEFDRYLDELDAGLLWLRRSPGAERNARRLVLERLPGRIRAWAARVAPREPVYGLALMSSVDSPELPPALGLGTVRELADWRQRFADRWMFRSYAWNPAEYRHFEPVPTELTDDPELVDAYATLNQAWRASGSDREPRSMLLRCARELQAVDWAAVLHTTDDFVVFVVEDEIDDALPRRLRATIPADVLKRLEADGR